MGLTSVRRILLEKYIARKRRKNDVLEYPLDRNRKVDTLKDIAADMLAKYISREGDVGDLEIPQALKSFIVKYLYR